MGSLLATELEPAAILEEVADQAPSLLGADACAIQLVEGDELVVSAVGGATAPPVAGSRSPSTARPAGDVVQARSPVVFADTEGDERLLADDPILAAGHAAYLGVPLVGLEQGLQGVLAVYSQRPRVWREEEVEALTALAGNASAVLSNAELYQRVALERERSYAILSNIADGIVAVDREGKVVLWNESAEAITGVPGAAALGRTPVEVLQRELASGDEGTAGERLLSIQRGGDEVWLSLTEAVMHDPVGSVSGRIFAFRDVSSERIVEEMKSTFVSTVSHQLRAPLTSIYGFAETLLRRDVLFGEEERRTFLEYIASEAQRLTTIVDTLLSVARLEAGDMQVELAPTDLRAVVSEASRASRKARPSTGTASCSSCPTSRSPLRPTARSSARSSGTCSTTRSSSRRTAERSRSRRIAGRAASRSASSTRARASPRPSASTSSRSSTARTAGGQRRRARALHRARARAGHGRSHLGRLGRGRRVELRVRAAARRGD